MKLKPRLPELLLSRFTIPELQKRLKGYANQLRHTEGTKSYKGIEAKIRLEEILKEKIRLRNGKRISQKKLSAKKTWLTHDKLLNHLTYDPYHGTLTNNKTGFVYNRDVGVEPKFNIKIGKFNYNPLELAWYYVTRKWSDGIMYQINGDEWDLRFRNLMSTTRKEMQGINLYRQSSGWNYLDQFYGVNNRIRYNAVTGLFFYKTSFIDEYQYRGDGGVLETEIEIFTQGQPACFINSQGYRSVKVGHSLFIHAHLVAWYLYTGERSSTKLTWLNNDKTDNRIQNLFDPLTHRTGQLQPKDIRQDGRKKYLLKKRRHLKDKRRYRHSH